MGMLPYFAPNYLIIPIKVTPSLENGTHEGLSNGSNLSLQFGQLPSFSSTSDLITG